MRKGYHVGRLNKRCSAVPPTDAVGCTRSQNRGNRRDRVSLHVAILHAVDLILRWERQERMQRRQRQYAPLNPFLLYFSLALIVVSHAPPVASRTCPYQRFDRGSAKM